jgi:peptidoglycan/LPS O-acetylase OafA/YrhL
MRKHQLDGLRFLLFLLVFATHYVPNPLSVGYLGYALPVFFVMSGFLITNVLLSTNHPSLWTRLKVFYSRRILRICPAYYLAVGLLIAEGALIYPGHYLAYLVNIKLFTESLGPSAPFYDWFTQAWRRESMHLWSLSVEEQFYIVYPLMLYLTPARYRTAMFLSVLVASIAARFWFMSHYPKSFYGTLLPICAEYFVWGCLFAWLESQQRLTRLSPGWAFGLSAPLIVGLIGAEFYLGQNGFLQFATSHYQTPIALAMGFFTWGLWSLRDDNPIVRILSWKPFVYFGIMSYTLYLIHLIAMDWYKRSDVELPFLTPELNLLVGGFGLSLLMGMAIWHLYEKPVYGLRRLLPYKE